MTPESIAQVYERARCLYSETEVEAALDKMADSISFSLKEFNPVMLCVMNGGLIVSGKLATRLDFPLQIDYLHATRYRDQTTGSELQWKVYPSLSLQNRVVLIVDDIFDEGATLEQIVAYCQKQGASHVCTAVLVDKNHNRKMTTLKADFIGIEAEDSYLFGYGMDYKGYFRNAAGIFAVDPNDF